MQRQELADLITRVCQKQFSLEGEVKLEPVPSGEGDLGTGVAFGLAKQLKRSPMEIADQLAAQIKHSDLEKIVAVAPGYLNFTFTNQYWVGQLAAIDDSYGRQNVGNGTKVQVEFISANPTGPTTIGNARGGFIGDVLARVLDYLGYDVTREYYFNNAGTQISKLVESVKVSAGVIQVEEEQVQYRGDYIEELAAEFKDRMAELSDQELADLLTATILERYIKPAVAKMGISFDVWFNERDLITNGQLATVIEALKTKGLVFEREGATWLDTAKLGVEREERVLIKSNGDPTYLAPDIAYHANVFGQRGFDWAIKELGPDHIAQFPSVKAAVEVLFPGKRLDMSSHQWFRLMRGGKEVKVSKRLGQFVTIVDLIEEIGADTARFFTLMRSSSSHIDFDLDLAREQSQKNPFFYVMYSYARACSVLAKAQAEKIAIGESAGELDQGRDLVALMTQFPELLVEISQDFGVHRLTFFGRELATAFHNYYEEVPILKGERASERLYVVERFARFMESYFGVLGIAPRSKM